MKPPETAAHAPTLRSKSVPVSVKVHATLAAPVSGATVDVVVQSGPADTPPGEDAPQVAVFSDTVTLRGIASDDGPVTSQMWRQISGPRVTLRGVGPSPTFTAPSVPGLLVFGLTVTDGDGNTSGEHDVPVAVHQNLTAAENLLSGTAKDAWDVPGVGDTAVLGFAQPYSVNAGEAVHFLVDGPADHLDVYRLGFYGGQGARLHATLVNTATQQPTKPDRIPGSNGAVECTNWTVTATWQVPVDTVSGQFIAVVQRTNSTRSQVPFIVRNDDRRADVVHKSADSTWHAYNYFGGTGDSWNQGACLYGIGNNWTTDTNRAYAVSWARPIVNRDGRPEDFLFNAEYPAIRFLEEVGLDVQYIGCQDLDRSADCLLGRKVFISSGHDEYWSQPMRDHAEIARDAGVNLIFWSGNEVFWRTRWNPADDPDRRIMWCYKDTMNGPLQGPDKPKAPGHEGETDDYVRGGGTPLDPVTWTGTFRDTRRPGGAAGEVQLTGTEFRMNQGNCDAVIDAAAYGSSPFWRDTEVTAGQNITLAGVIGFEADEVGPLTGGAVLVAETTVTLDGTRADDNGQIYTESGPMRWGIVLRQYPSGAVVVGFGTVQWAWSLSDSHDRQASVPSQAARQATLNLLTDMGATSANVPTGLVGPVAVDWSSYRPPTQ